MSDDVTATINEDEQESDRGLYALRAALAVFFLLLLVFLLVWFLWLRWSTVPNVRGMREKEAVERLEHDGFDVGLITESTLTRKEGEAGFRAGQVVRQDPAGGSRAAKGTHVDIRVAGGYGGGAVIGTSADMGIPKTLLVTVPDVVGKQEDNAMDRLYEAGLDGSSSSVNGVVRRGEVVKQSPKPGTKVRRGSNVRMQVSAGIGGGTAGTGPVVPDVLGETLSSARGILSSWGYGARVRYGPSTTSVEKGLVYYQKPGAGDPGGGGVVTIWISRGVLKGGSPYPDPEPPD